jgi:hypothetical protein
MPLFPGIRLAISVQTHITAGFKDSLTPAAEHTEPSPYGDTWLVAPLGRISRMDIETTENQPYSYKYGWSFKRLTDKSGSVMVI